MRRCGWKSRPACERRLSSMDDLSIAPVALDHKAGPEVRIPPSFRLGHLPLRDAERGGGLLSAFKHLTVEPFHELRGGKVVHLPETGHDAARAGDHEPSRETDDPFAI